MGLEAVTYISDLVITNPTAGDAKSEGDDHLRAIKVGLKNSFPNVNGAVTPTVAEFNRLVGVTSGIQAQLDAKQPLTSPSFTTGDAKLTLKVTADATWVMMNDGTIGDATSGATTRANADTVDLFTLLWNNITNTWAPVSAGRGANAAADFAAHKTIALTKQLGRALGISGTGSGLTARAIGENLGEEAHAQTTPEMAAHGHGVNDPGHVHSISPSNGRSGGSEGWGGASAILLSVTYSILSAVTGVTIQSTGSGTPANVMQPTAFWNVMIKL